MREKDLWREFEKPGSSVWAVYGDELQERGDPRGLLIALEQRSDALGEEFCEESELGGEISDLYEAHGNEWLQGLLDQLESHDHGFYDIRWRYGFLRSIHATHYDLADLDLLEALLRTSSSMYVAEFHENVRVDSILPVLATIAKKVRPWRRCSIELSRNWRHEPAEQKACQAFAAAVPHLLELSLCGHNLLASLHHEGLQQLSLSGISIADFGGEDEEQPSSVELPSVYHLDLAVHAGGFETSELTASQCSGRGLPRLRSLDLSRNILQSGTGPEPIFSSDCLLKSPLLKRIEHLILPPFYSEAAALMCVDNASVLSAIAKVEVPKVLTHYYDPRPALAPLPNLIFGSPYPFRLPQQVHGREVIEFMLHDEGGHWYSFAKLCELVIDNYSTMSEPVRSTITAIMQTFERINYGGDGEPESETLALPPIVAAFEELGEEAFEEAELQYLFKRVIIHSSCCTEVTIEKVWGW